MKLPAVRALIIRLGLCASMWLVTATSVLLSAGTTRLILEQIPTVSSRFFWAGMMISVCVPLLVAPPTTWLVGRLILRAESGRQRAQRLAMFDPLTGAVNRRQFFLQGQQELARAHRSSQGVALLLLDLDHFKRINDSHGHSTGDAVLKAAAERCAEHLRSSDILARLGGEEFAILLADVTEAQAVEAAERVRLGVQELAIVSPRGASVRPTVSIGVKWNRGDLAPLDSLLAAADHSMYAAKRGGRNRVSVHPNSDGRIARALVAGEAPGGVLESPTQRLGAPMAALNPPAEGRPIRRAAERDSRILLRLSETISRSGRGRSVLWLTTLSISISVGCGTLLLIGPHAMRDDISLLMTLCVAIPALVVPPLGWVVTTLSIEADAAQRAAEGMAMTDPLTGLCNRRHFLSVATREFGRAMRIQRPLSILILDIDHFKSINDTHGHAIGDKVLIHVAQTCLGCTRPFDTLARLGGEEFVILLPETGLETGLAIAERVRAAVANDVGMHPPGGAAIRTTLSIGVAVLAHGDDGIQPVMERADDAMYTAKNSGRNRVCAARTGKQRSPDRASA